MAWLTSKKRAFGLRSPYGEERSRTRNYIGEEGVLKSNVAPLVLDFEQVSLCKKRDVKACFRGIDHHLDRSAKDIHRQRCRHLWKSLNPTGILRENCRSGC